MPIDRLTGLSSRRVCGALPEKPRYLAKSWTEDAGACACQCQFYANKTPFYSAVLSALPDCFHHNALASWASLAKEDDCPGQLRGGRRLGLKHLQGTAGRGLYYRSQMSSPLGRGLLFKNLTLPDLGCALDTRGGSSGVGSRRGLAQ